MQWVIEVSDNEGGWKHYAYAHTWSEGVSKSKDAIKFGIVRLYAVQCSKIFIFNNESELEQITQRLVG